MRRWLAIGLLGLSISCKEKSTDWGQTCRLYIDKVTEDCQKYGKKGTQWPQVCGVDGKPGYLEAIQTMKNSIPAEGTFKEKFDAAEPACEQNLKTFNELTKDPKDFPH